MTNTTHARDTETGGAAPLIPGMTDEGETLSTEIADATQASHLDAETKQKFGTSRADRTISYDLADFPQLTGREEEWRFTPIERLSGLELPGGDEQRLTGPAPQVTVEETQGVTVETVGRDDQRLGQAFIPDDRVSAAAWHNFQEATVITVADETELDKPLLVDIAGQSQEPAAQHVRIHIGRHSQVVLVINQSGSAVLGQNIEITVDEGASLNVVSIQAWDEGSVHAGSQQAKVGRDAKYRHTLVTYGGSLVRLTPTTRFAGPGANVEMYGLYFADAGQHLEHRIFVDHSTENCVSDALYKGALQGDSARTVWVGDVLIRKEAEGTDTYEKNENLLLTDGAQADSVPNLEIETGVIEGGGHASSTGRFDENQLFYLMARGIPEPQARKLIVRGFLNEIIQKIGIDDVERRLVEVMEAEIRGLEF